MIKLSRLIKLFCFILLAANLLSHCANQASVQAITQISIYNSGTYPMQSPMACYYQSEDPKQCIAINPDVLSIAPGESESFSIKANQKVRLVFPFDSIVKANNIVYRPNCHILSDFFVFEEKQYLAEAQMIANASRPENGFNCALKIFDQNTIDAEKSPMDESASTYIRYRVPRKGELKAGYVSNYHWQQFR